MKRPTDRGVLIDVRLPWDLADDADRLRTSDPDFFRRLIVNALARRRIHASLNEQLADRADAAADRVLDHD